MERMTCGELLKTNRVVIPGTWAAQVMGMDTGRFFEYARAGKLPFRCIVSGNRVKVPRVPFLIWLGFTEREIETRRERT